VSGVQEETTWNDLWKENYETVFVKEYRTFMLRAVDSLVSSQGAGKPERPSPTAATPLVLLERTDLVAQGLDADNLDEETDTSNVEDDRPSSPEFPDEGDFDESDYKDDGLTYNEDMEDGVEDMEPNRDTDMVQGPSGGPQDESFENLPVRFSHFLKKFLV
jgi:hypothetical protein